jgi:hypothetical protein
MFAGARAAVGKLLSQMGMQGMKEPIKAGLSAIKPSGAFDAAMTYAPDLLFTGLTMSQLPQGTTGQEALLAGAENLAVNSLLGSVGGRFLGGSIAPSIARRRGLAPRTPEYDDMVTKVRTGTEMALGLGAGFAPLPYTSSLFERGFQRAQADPELEEMQRQQLEQQQMISALGNAGAVGLRGLYEAIPADPYDMRTYMGLL